jgi:hypothetical protein
MFAADTEAGGKGEFVETGIYEQDGHARFNGRGGARLWEPPVERYLQERGVLGPG